MVSIEITARPKEKIKNICFWKTGRVNFSILQHNENRYVLHVHMLSIRAWSGYLLKENSCCKKNRLRESLILFHSMVCVWMAKKEFPASGVKIFYPMRCVPSCVTDFFLSQWLPILFFYKKLFYKKPGLSYQSINVLYLYKKRCTSQGGDVLSIIPCNSLRDLWLLCCDLPVISL